MRLAGAAAVLALALAILALAPGRASDGRTASPTPAAGAASWADSPLLRSAEGTLWWVSERCGTGKLVLAERRIVNGPAEHCALYPSPDGSTVLATQSDSDPPSPPGRVVVMDATLHARARTDIRADSVYPPISWAPGGALAAVCELRTDGLRETMLVDRSGVTQRRLPGLCRPAYLGDDTVAVTDSRNVYVGQAKLHIQSDLAGSIGSRTGRYSIEALAAQRDALFVSVAHVDGSLVGAPGAVVVFDRRSREARAFTVARGGYATELGISPDATAFWYRSGAANATLVSNGRVLAPSIPRVAQAFAWSPDGTMLAVAQRSRLEIYELASGRHVTVDVRDLVRLSWTL